MQGLAGLTIIVSIVRSYFLARCDGTLSFETHHLVLPLKLTIGIAIMLFETTAG
jgi:hypothetical protein